MSDPVEVTLLGKTFALSGVKSFATRNEVVASGGQNPTRALAAALGLSLPPSAIRLKTKYGPPFDPLTYGGEVIDELLERGSTILEVIAAGEVAYTAMARSLPSFEEVERVKEGFPLPAPEVP